MRKEASMFNVYLALGVFFGLFLILLISVLAGRRFALWQMRHDALEKVQVVNVAEGAVYA